jgi:hypothetical protein
MCLNIISNLKKILSKSNPINLTCIFILKLVLYKNLDFTLQDGLN